MPSLWSWERGASDSEPQIIRVGSASPASATTALYSKTSLDVCSFTMAHSSEPSFCATSLISRGIDAPPAGDSPTDFHVLTWNACGLEAGAITDMVALLPHMRWDAICIQEGPFAEEECCKILETGHTLFLNASGANKRSVGLLINKRWDRSGCTLSFSSSTERVAIACLEYGCLRLCLISVHMPHAGYSDEDFEATLLAIEETVLESRKNRRLNIVGIDANSIIGRASLVDDSRIVGSCGIGDRNQRGDSFVSWLHGNRLCAVTTIKPSRSHTWTHKLWRDGSTRQIDFVLTDEIRQENFTQWEVLDILDGTSDHRAVYTCFSLSSQIPRIKRRHRVQFGWKPHLDPQGKPAQFHTALDRLVAEPSSNSDIACAIVAAATVSGTTAKTSNNSRSWSPELRALMEARRQTQDAISRQYLSKKIWRQMRQERRQRDEERLRQLVLSGAGKTQLQRFTHSQTGTSRIHRMKDQHGHTHTEQESICEVFARFYEDLYKDSEHASQVSPMCAQQEAPICDDEVRVSLNHLKNLKTGADDGLVAEMLKTEHSGLVSLLASFYTAVLNGERIPPDSWRLTTIKVLFKKGEPDLPKNYRPISIIPVLAKLFSTILYRRIQPLVDEQLAQEQYGFRPGRGCVDAVHVLRMVVEKSSEWGEPLFIAALDVEKAFDRVHHKDLFEALLTCGAGVRLITTLRTFYAGLQARVRLWDGAESRIFDVQRGVRQGDPLSTLLFNLVLNEALAEARVVWDRRSYGTEVGRPVSGARLTHVAFADDCTLVAKTWTSLSRMILTLREALLKRGLSLHPSKCQAQTNIEDWNRRGSIAIADNFSIDFLQEDQPIQVLGTVLALKDYTRAEIRHRIAVGWRSFWSLKPLLLHSGASIHQRLKLFDATVASSVLWCSQSWALREEEKRILSKTRRSMLRRIVKAKRFADESYVDWIIRATRRAENFATASRVREWVETHRKTKWMWAGHVARSSADSWLWRTTSWRDAYWQQLTEASNISRPLRPAKRRWTRWEDGIRLRCPTWMEAAYDREWWRRAG